MLHGQIIPVQRKSVEFGQTYLNGDIVRMPDYMVNMELPHVHDIADIVCLWHTCDNCGLLWDNPCQNGTCKYRCGKCKEIMNKMRNPYPVDCNHTKLDIAETDDTTNLTDNPEQPDNCYFCGKHWTICIESDCEDKRAKLMQFASDMYNSDI